MWNLVFFFQSGQRTGVSGGFPTEGAELYPWGGGIRLPADDWGFPERGVSGINGAVNATPPPPPPSIDRDSENLNLLAIFYYVLSGLGLIGLLFLGMHFAIMNKVMMNPQMWEGSGAPPPDEFFGIFRWFYVVAGLFIVVSIVLNVMAGFFMQQRRHRTFTLIVAGLNCLNFPLGTALGVFTIIVLMRPTVIRVYEQVGEGEGSMA